MNENTVLDAKKPGYFKKTFVYAFLLVFALTALWSLATPLFGGPDEPVQVIKAVAVARGELTGRLVGNSHSSFGKVSVPQYYAKTRNIPTCFHRNPKQSADCAPLPHGSSTPTDAFTYVDRYPPLYYLFVGLPSLLGEHRLEIYLMRLSSAALSSLFVALAVAACLRYAQSPIILTGVVMGATPLLMFLAGVVNPAGLEASAALATWTSGAIMLRQYKDGPPKPLVTIFIVSSVVFELIRGLSPFWLFLTGIVLALSVPRRNLFRLLESRYVKTAGVVIAAFGALATVWIFSFNTLNLYSRTKVPYSMRELKVLEIAFGRSMQFIHQIIGVFGWSDTSSPFGSYLIYICIIISLIILALFLGDRHDIYSLSALIATAVIMPIIISSSQVHQIGFVWSGRDSLPVAVGIPVLSAETISRNYQKLFTLKQVEKLSFFVLWCVLIARVFSYMESLRRNAVGTLGPDFSFLIHAPFNPTIGNFRLLLLEILVLSAAVLSVKRAIRHRMPELNLSQEDPGTETEKING